MLVNPIVLVNGAAQKTELALLRATVLNNFLWFTRGDVFTIGYRLRGFGYVFTGLCVRVRFKSMRNSATTFLLRNIFAKISVELYATLYGLSRLNFKFLDYAKKKFNYRSAKLYYLRDKDNVES